MMIPSTAKAVLFDMDGVVFNTEDLAHDVFAQIAKRYGVKFNESDHKEILGTAEQFWSAFFVKKWCLKISAKEFAVFFWQNLAYRTETDIKLMPDFLSAIQKMKMNGLKTALVTSTPRLNVDPLLEKFQLRDFFDVVVTGDEVEHGKPSPEPYILAIKRLELKPDECVVIEDAVSGVKSAKTAGCYVIAVPTKHATGLNYEQADVLISSLSEIS